MDGITTRVYRRVKRYWRRKPYIRLGGLNRPRRFWRIRVTSKLKLKLKKKLKLRYSPKKLLTGIRDGYVNMMTRMANSPVVAGSGGFGEGVAKFGMKPVKEYDERLIMEMYKTMVLRQAQLATNFGV
ncbi:hypothetical protein HanRHA438_Chr04g0186701 [Helianthus annuus]|uniref:Uncharacterized protein n=1 Tax=Helianthus annuus TaxID=4232 RepID=A0A251V179_HELAN|nr:uncharacterized protein LOC110934074 [Helianthus annuus]KAF5811060.1 hypothetical protein HanXRQr2_Chr04g0177041 [Helianthus annuus]KAJ0581787.1 hypothetical protein HanHA300_Chr04g0145121 [Helianthus annuus]KAJ0589847.1 hypothetical protein HanIR_Chr04g0190831 [Helianthus annuus]KAJ0597748.1 hypothetical protein HanHA89_Chr04g0158181 [Helianthus annuus]KAJ0758392.1 hypothetical protein HanLR1_Chr04g0149891 [Helianthus annuus]